jgi:hypothetical protein
MRYFTRIYLLLGLVVVAIFGFMARNGGFEEAFGRYAVDTASREGYWYTYRSAPSYSSGPGRSPGTSGGSYGSGGYSGGK